MAQSRPRDYSPAEWEAMRPFIGEAYGTGMTQKKLLQILAQRGFPVTPAQLKKRLTDWELLRNVKRKEYLSYIRQQNYNAQHGRKSAFIMRGKEVQDHKIARAAQRFSREIEALNDDPASIHSVDARTLDDERNPRPPSMLNLEYFTAALTLSEIDEAMVNGPQSGQYKKNTLQELLDSNGSHTFQSMEVKRIEALRLHCNAFHDSFLRTDRSTQLSVCMKMWAQASKCYSESRPKEVEILQVVVVEWLPKLVHNRHPYLVSSIGLLASACGEQAKYIDGEKNHRLQLEISKSVHGDNHAITLSSRHDLATLYMHTGRLGLAMEYAETAYNSQCKVVGKRHRDSLYSLMTIGGVFLRSKNHSEARRILKEVLRNFTKQLGQDAVFTFRAEQELARCEFESGELSAAKKLYTESVNKQRIALGEDHHETISGTVRLARVLVRLYEFDEAERLLLQAIEVFGNRNGVADPVTLRAKLLLADVYEGQGKDMDTMDVQHQVLRDNAGREHKCPWILEGLAQAAWRLFRTAERTEAIEVQELVVRMSRLQVEPAEETAKHVTTLQLMQEG